MSTLTRLEDVFRSVLSNDDLALREEMTAANVPGWDSVAHINLMYSIEETFGLQFPGNELAEFKNIGDLVKYVDQHATR
ncbi:MAG TPA: acyl carrier protein [Phycisphaerales bacterium]|nr:acyl carrier protein [Phycisphaerales bacterium]